SANLPAIAKIASAPSNHVASGSAHPRQIPSDRELVPQTPPEFPAPISRQPISPDPACTQPYQRPKVARQSSNLAQSIASHEQFRAKISFDCPAFRQTFLRAYAHSKIHAPDIRGNVLRQQNRIPARPQS